MVVVAVVVAAVALQPGAAPATRGVRHMHSHCQLLEVLDTSVKQQLDKLVSRGDTLLGKEIASHILDATQHKHRLEATEQPSLQHLAVQGQGFSEHQV